MKVTNLTIKMNAFVHVIGNLAGNTGCDFKLKTKSSFNCRIYFETIFSLFSMFIHLIKLETLPDSNIIGA